MINVEIPLRVVVFLAPRKIYPEIVQTFSVTGTVLWPCDDLASLGLSYELIFINLKRTALRLIS